MNANQTYISAYQILIISVAMVLYVPGAEENDGQMKPQ
jgi:hypothetical protein